MIKPFILGITASFFFAFTFLFNHQMNITGDSWYWSSSLRFLLMLPILFLILAIRRELSDVIRDIRKKPISWLIWSTVGFGIFYAPLCFASTYGASWLVAATWQITIIAGALMTPLFYTEKEAEEGIHRIRHKIPIKSLAISSLILLGIFVIQFEEAKKITDRNMLAGVVPVIIAAFAYPLGNRKMIEVCSKKLNTIQRVFGMTLCSMPFWIVISVCGLCRTGIPGGGQIIQSFVVAVFAGIIATLLFFKATDLVSHDVSKLAVIESTQSGEVIFTLLGGIFIFHDRIPTIIGFLGILIVVAGMILNNLFQTKSSIE